MGESLKTMAKNRLLDEMLGSVRETGGAEWSVLVMDDVTTRVMSHSCRISDVLDYGISLVETVTKRREPLPSLSGVYFLTPTEASVRALCEDWKLRPLYKTAHVFFSSRVPPALLALLRECPGLTARLRSLKEVNLEFLVVDRRTFLADRPAALQALFGEASASQELFAAEVAAVADRLATVLACLKEYPAIRFRAGKPWEEGGAEAQSLVAQRIAVSVDERLAGLQRSGQVPAGAETCELVITDRGFDPVAPVIHEWTYEAMVFDLLPLEGNVYRYEIETEGGKAEVKSHILDERDALWVELRHQHFAAASIRISALLDEFRAKHQAASYVRGAKEANGGGLDMRGMRNLVKSLPQYREQLAALSVHADIASRLNRTIDERALVEMGKLEQDLVYGAATSKEVVTFLGYHQGLPPAEKLRLLMCYAATHPEKLDATKQAQWQKLAGLSGEDMATVTNLEFLGVPVRKRGKTTGGLNFGRKRKRAVRKDRPPGEDERTWELSRFVPMLQEVVEDLAAGSLSPDEYPYVRPPTAPGNGAGAGPKGVSVRRPAAGWARKASGTTAPAAAAGGIAEVAPRGRRVIVFVVGGITRSEMRVAHTLSKRLGRDIVLGGTSLDDPPAFLRNLLELGMVDGEEYAAENAGDPNALYGA